MQHKRASFKSLGSLLYEECPPTSRNEHGQQAAGHAAAGPCGGTAAFTLSRQGQKTGTAIGKGCSDCPADRAVSSR